MKCSLCDEEIGTRKFDGQPICKVCVEKARGARDHINSTRKSPLNNLNPIGQKPVTTKEVLTEALIKKIEDRNTEDNNEDA